LCLRLRLPRCLVLSCVGFASQTARPEPESHVGGRVRGVCRVNSAGGCSRNCNYKFVCRSYPAASNVKICQILKANTCTYCGTNNIKPSQQCQRTGQNLETHCENLSLFFLANRVVSCEDRQTFGRKIIWATDVWVTDSLQPLPTNPNVKLAYRSPAQAGSVLPGLIARTASEPRLDN